jgi:hypothetical protein
MKQGKFECSAEKLQILIPDFIKYKDMDSQEQDNFLKTISNVDKFKMLYSDWNQGNLTCYHNNEIYSISESVVEEIPDPLVIKSIEKSMGRYLTEEEKSGETSIWTDGKNYFDKYKKGMVIFKIPTMKFL